jgi:hypothetical protein
MQQIRIAIQYKKAPDLERFLIWKSKVVRVISESLQIIEEEIDRWREILAVPYQVHLSSIRGQGFTPW